MVERREERGERRVRDDFLREFSFVFAKNN